MKKKLVAFLIGGLFALMTFGTVCQAKTGTYQATLEVIGCSTDGFIGYREDFVEFSVDWVGDWKLGDKVDVIMHDNGTDKKSDDYVVEILDHRRDAAAEKKILIGKAKDVLGSAKINIIENIKNLPILNRRK